MCCSCLTLLKLLVLLTEILIELESAIRSRKELVESVFFESSNDEFEARMDVHGFVYDHYQSLDSPVLVNKSIQYFVNK